MKSILFFTLLFSLFLTPKYLKAQSFFVCDNKGNIGKVNIANCTYKSIPLNNSVIFFADITFHPNGKLYGYLLGDIYEIDTIPNSTPRIIAHSDSISASSLTTDKNGIIYGAGIKLWSYNVATNKFRIHGDMIADNELIEAAGDLTFYNSNLYVSSNKNKMIQLNIEDPTKSTTFLTFNSQDTVLGIMSYKDCGRVRTFATTNDSNARVLEIDWKTKTTKPVCNLPVIIFGAASEYEFLASASDTTFVEQYTCDANKAKVTTQNLLNSQKCDSVVTTKIIYAGSNPTYLKASTCEISKVGTTSVNLKNQRGCDSTVYTTLTLKIDTINAKRLICEGDSMMFGNKILKSSGQYTQILKTKSGCDSLVNLDLTVAKKDSIFQEKQTCNKQKAGFQREFLKNKQGCDSLVVTLFTLKNEIKFAQKLSLCEGKSISVGDTTLKTSGIYVKILKNTEGCDSIVTTELTVTTLDLKMPNDTVLNLGDSVKLIGLSQTTLPVKWQWTPNTFLDCDTCLATWAKPVTSIMYRLAVYDTLSKCRKEGVVYVKTKTECDAYIPNAFSPNDDGVNDKLMIYLDKCVKRVKRFALFSRWGNPITQTDYTNIDSPREVELWNGIIDGKVATNEVYVYFIEVEYINGQTKIVSGDTTLMR
jgi:gliding motility-associated-like protein